MRPATYVLWFGPAGILLIGLVGGAFWLRRRRGASEAASPLSEEEQRRLDAILLEADLLLMTFAVICALLVLAVLAALSRPLLSRAPALPTRGQYDQAVYRDQLQEVERDLARGVLTQDEAGAARLEIQRRLLAADAHGEETKLDRPARSPLLAMVAILFVVLGAGGLYWRLGAPGLADAPFATRPSAPEDPEQSREAADVASHGDIKQAAERLEQKLLKDPSNAIGWILYGRTQSMLGDWNKAADAYKRAIDLDLKSADAFAGYGEMLVMAAWRRSSRGTRCVQFSTSRQMPEAVSRGFIWLWPMPRGAKQARRSMPGWNWPLVCRRARRCVTRSPGE